MIIKINFKNLDRMRIFIQKMEMNSRRKNLLLISTIWLALKLKNKIYLIIFKMEFRFEIKILKRLYLLII